MNSSWLIDYMGGTTKTASLCGLGKSAVSNWRRSGIPIRWRIRLAPILAQQGIALDLETGEAHWSNDLTNDRS